MATVQTNRTRNADPRWFISQDTRTVNQCELSQCLGLKQPNPIRTSNKCPLVLGLGKSLGEAAPKLSYGLDGRVCKYRFRYGFEICFAYLAGTSTYSPCWRQSAHRALTKRARTTFWGAGDLQKPLLLERVVVAPHVYGYC